MEIILFDLVYHFFRCNQQQIFNVQLNISETLVERSQVNRNSVTTYLNSDHLPQLHLNSKQTLEKNKIYFCQMSA